MTLKNLTLVISSLFLISCGSDGSGPKAQSTKAEKRGKQAIRAAGTAAEAAVTKPSGSTWGRVYLDESEQDYQTQATFQKQVELLLEPQFRADEVGDVSGVDDSTLPDDQKNDTGIAFWAKGLSFKDGFDPNRNDYPEAEDFIKTDADASLRLSIYRSLKSGGSGAIEEIPIHFNDEDHNVDSGGLIVSYILGNYIQVIFADVFGKVSISGRFDKSMFVGQVHFLTQKTDQENTGNLIEVTRDPELLGRFSVETCGFFTCTK